MTEILSNMPRLFYLVWLSVAAIAAALMQKCLHLVEQLSVNVADINKRLDALAETTRHDFATQWQQQFQSTLSEQQNELETCIMVQAERLAAQSKQISLMRDKTNTVVTQNDDIQTYQQKLIDSLLEKQTRQQELIESLQRQHDNLREKTEETFRAQAAQFNRRFAFQQELRGEYDRLSEKLNATSKATQLIIAAAIAGNITHHVNQWCHPGNNNNIPTNYFTPMPEIFKNLC